MHFICPVCNKKLNSDETRTVCENGHSFDKARGGYYNLLISNTASCHGDNREMVLSRRAFLSRGYYEPLANRIAELAVKYTPKMGALLDAGAGEGYYTDHCERALLSRDGVSDVSAFDISKNAVREISKKNPRISLAVAGSYHMPIADGEFDTVVNTFSPLALEETFRVLKPGGTFIMAIPGEMHLYDLKSAVYKTPYKNTVSDTELAGFETVSDESLSYVMHLSNSDDVRSLFMMTPYAYRTNPEDKKKIETLEELDCTADFRIFVYRKRTV